MVSVKPLKICLTCSAGGHLTELLQLSPAWAGMKVFYVTDRRAKITGIHEREKVYFVRVPRRNPIHLTQNIVQSFRIFLMEKPDVLISTGADVSIPLLLIGKLFGKKIVFIESFCRIDEPSLSAKIMYGFSDLFYVQWPKMKKFFPKAREGSVF